MVHLRGAAAGAMDIFVPSHREAPETAKDPVADSSDLYTFVSPDRPDSVTLIADYVPMQLPSDGPNFFELGDDVRYEIHIDNDATPDVTYRCQLLGPEGALKG